MPQRGPAARARGAAVSPGPSSCADAQRPTCAARAAHVAPTRPRAPPGGARPARGGRVLRQPSQWQARGVTRASDIADALAQHPEAPAVDLLGPPAWRRGGEVRWGTNGSLKLDVAGPRRGRWTCFDPGDARFGAEGRGDMLDLIGLVRGGNTAEAVRWARAWLRLPEPARMPSSARPAPRPALARVPSTPKQADAERAVRIARALDIWGAAQALWAVRRRRTFGAG